MQTDKSPSQTQNIKNIFSTDVVILTVLGLALLIFSICRRGEALPAASLDLKVNKTEAVNLARVYADTTGFTVPKKIISSTYFSHDSDASTFLEYEYPLSVADELMRKEIPVWHWKVHLLDGHDDQLQVWIGANGSLYSFEREMYKEKPAPSISHDDARKKAVDCALNEMHLNLSEWTIIEDAVAKLPKRTDHAFTWEAQTEISRADICASVPSYLVTSCQSSPTACMCLTVFNKSSRDCAHRILLLQALL